MLLKMYYLIVGIEMTPEQKEGLNYSEIDCTKPYLENKLREKHQVDFQNQSQDTVASK